MQITTAKLKNADGSFEYLGIGADANYITLKNGENFEEAASEVNNNTSNMDLTYQILDKELKTSIPVDVELNRNIAEFSSRDPQTNVIKTNRAKVKNEDGWSEDIPIAAAAVNIDLNNGNNAEDTFENLEVKLNELNEKYDELKLLVSTVVEGDPVTVNSSGMDYMDTIVYGNSEQKSYRGYNLANLDKETITKYGLTITNNGDGSFTINGTSTSAMDIVLTKNTMVDTTIYDFEEGTYLLKTFVESGSINNNNQVVKTVIQGKNGDNADYSMISNMLSNSVFAATKALTSNHKMSRIEIFVGGADVIFNNYKIRVLLAKSSDINLAYEPYVGGQPSPNPEYPQDIEVINGVNIWDEEWEVGGYASNNGTKYDDSLRIRSVNYIEVKANTNYYIVASEQLKICFYDNLYGFISYVVKNNVFITTPENCKYVTFSTNLTTYGTIYKNDIAIIKGTTPKPYLPHGHIGLRQSGKNLFNPNTVSSAYINDDDGGYYPDNQSRCSDFIEIEGGKKYFIAPKLTSGNWGAWYDKNKTFITGFNTYNKVFTAPDNAKYMRLTVSYNSSNPEYATNFYIIQSDVEVPYEPYHSPKVYPINLNGNSIAKVGDIKDLLKIYRNGDVEIEKKIGKVVLDGSENWNSIELKNNVYLIKRRDTELLYTKHNYMCDHFSITTNENNKNGEISNCYWNYYNIQVAVEEITTINDLKTWLSEHPTGVYYQLATPETIKLPPIEPIQLWEGTNIFKLITNLDTTMQVDYYKNYEKYVISNIDF